MTLIFPGERSWQLHHVPMILGQSRISGFFNTNLPTLLEDLGVRKLIVTGVAGNICVLFTVNDAYMNDFRIAVPKDCIASNTKKENDFALKQMKELMKVNTAGAASLKL